MLYPLSYGGETAPFSGTVNFPQNKMQVRLDVSVPPVTSLASLRVKQRTLRFKEPERSHPRVTAPAWRAFSWPLPPRSCHPNRLVRGSC